MSKPALLKVCIRCLRDTVCGETELKLMARFISMLDKDDKDNEQGSPKENKCVSSILLT